MLKSILCLAGVAIGGGLIGYGIHTKELDFKIQYCNDLIQKIKDNNNRFLSNVATIVNDVNGEHNTFTEIDEYVMTMWME